MLYPNQNIIFLQFFRKNIINCFQIKAKTISFVNNCYVRTEFNLIFLIMQHWRLLATSRKFKRNIFHLFPESGSDP